MQNVLRAAASSRIGLVGLLLAASLSGCDTVSDWFGSSKTPLAGERVPVFSERSELEPDKETASVPVVLPAPSVNDSWPQSGGFAN
jgi:outer membrane protein assembly factor BamB